MAERDSFGTWLGVYGERRWSMVPLHGIEGGACTCHNPQCSSPGKHPLTEHGVKDATRDFSLLWKYRKRYPSMNLGIATGNISQLVVLDIDPRNGGEDSLDDLLSQHGKLPRTIEQITGGGGRHLLFAYPGRTIRNRVLSRGIDVRGDGGLIVVEPSMHVSGKPYRWELTASPENPYLRPAPLPAWVLQQVVDVPRSAEVVAQRISVGARNTTLTSLAGSMRRRGFSERAIEQALLVMNEERCVPPLDPEEVRQIARSIAKYVPEVGR